MTSRTVRLSYKSRTARAEAERDAEKLIRVHVCYMRHHLVVRGLGDRDVLPGNNLVTPLGITKAPELYRTPFMYGCGLKY